MFDNIPSDPLGFIKFIIAFGIVLYVIWLATGGFERAQERERPFLNEPAPLDEGGDYGPEDL